MNYQVGPAAMAEAEGILKIIRPLARAKRLQERDLSDIRNRIDDFWVGKLQGRVIACAELRMMDPKRIAEVWSLGVAQKYEGCGYEVPLLRQIIVEAGSLGLEKVYTVSDRIAALEAAGFFVPATGEKNILFFYPREREIPEVNGGLAVEIWPAQLSETATIFTLIRAESRKGNLLSRSYREIEALILQGCSFSAKREEEIVGHIALDIYNSDQAEVRSFLVAPGFTGQKVGKKLIAAVCQEARRRALKELMTVTKQASIFQEMGFGFATRLLTEARWVYPLEGTRGEIE